MVAMPASARLDLFHSKSAQAPIRLPVSSTQAGFSQTTSLVSYQPTGASAKAAQSSGTQPVDPEGIERLVQDSGGAAVSVSAATGAVSFVRMNSEQSQNLSEAQGFSGSLEERSAQFFKAYGTIFGISDFNTQLKLLESKTDSLGNAHLTYQQVHQSVPVYAALLRVHFDQAQRISAVNGASIPDIQLNTKPTISADEAAGIALSAVGASDLAVKNNTLYVYRKDLTKGVPGQNHLVYGMEVTNDRSVREMVFVDAHFGKIVERYSLIEDALHRVVYDGGYGAGFQVWEEGDPLPFVGADITQTVNINSILSGSLETYNLFSSAFGWDSFNNAGAFMETVNNDPTISCPNANWNGISTNYCNGVTGDDTVAHEWGHAYTDYTHNLIYQWQSGALNESYSDIWGEVVDFLNNRGTDTPDTLRTADACSLYSTPPPVLAVNAPAAIAGDYPAGAAAFGAPLTPTGITADVVLASDGVGTGIPPSPADSDACEPLINGAAVSGKIALIDRGTCSFVIKVKNAQNAGAIGVIIANHVTGGNGVISMAGVDPTIVIPSLSIGYSNGNLIKGQLAVPEVVNTTLRRGTGLTDDSYRWLSGEDDPAFGEAIRDMWNPGCYGDPNKVSDINYVCSTTDNGGVHTNSGVPNHAFALIVDGGTFNGQTVTGIGLTKAGHIYWRSQEVYQTPSSNFVDHADAIEQSCTDLVGQNLNSLSTTNPAQVPSGVSITAGDCAEVHKAMLAVEMRTPPTQCNFQPLLNPNTPPLCGTGQGNANSAFLESFESGATGWTVTITGPFTSTLPFEWKLDSTLPGGRSGSGMFADDDGAGDCAGGNNDFTRVTELYSPIVTIPLTTTYPRLAFDHYVASELGWDGGNVKISVNGGAFTPIVPADYTFNSYNLDLNGVGAGNTNPLAGEPAFTGTDGGSVGGTWGQSQVDLRNYANPGDTVQLRFDFGTDGCGGVDGWYLDDVNMYSCSSEAAPSVSVSAPAKAPANGTMQYSIDVSLPVTGTAYLTDTLPSGVNFIGNLTASSGTATYDNGSGSVLWNNVAAEAPGVVTITFDVHVAPTPGSITNTIELYFNGEKRTNFVTSVVTFYLNLPVFFGKN
jgi:Zn-dependent metalloprotease